MGLLGHGAPLADSAYLSAHIDKTGGGIVWKINRAYGVPVEMLMEGHLFHSIIDTASEESKERGSEIEIFSRHPRGKATLISILIDDLGEILGKTSRTFLVL